MRPIPMVGMEVAFQGAPWDHALPPCSKAAIPLLEKNERVVSWVRPVGGAVHEHIPAIQYKSKYYSLSLRMQKAIYRHIRLKKGFRNVEVMDGVTRLRIPDVLLREKLRTQSRFEVCSSLPESYTPQSHCCPLLSVTLCDTMTSSAPPPKAGFPKATPLRNSACVCRVAVGATYKADRAPPQAMREGGTPVPPEDAPAKKRTHAPARATLLPGKAMYKVHDSFPTHSHTAAPSLVPPFASPFAAP